MICPEGSNQTGGAKKTDYIFVVSFFIFIMYGSDRRHAAAFLCNKKRTKGLPR